MTGMKLGMSWIGLSKYATAQPETILAGQGECGCLRIANKTCASCAIANNSFFKLLLVAKSQLEIGPTAVAPIEIPTAVCSLDPSAVRLCDTTTSAVTGEWH